MRGGKAQLPILLAFLALVIVQLAVPVSMINKRQMTLQEGTAYKFRIGPVDPYDPFLGRYMVLDLEAATYEGWQGETLEPGQTLYAVLDQDADGFARVMALSMDAPGTRDYLKARVAWQSGEQVRLKLPFDRYYLEEYAAQAAWRIRRGSQQQAVEAHILVKLSGGFGVLEELYFNDKPILEYMQARGFWGPDKSPDQSTAPANTDLPSPVTEESAPPIPDGASENKAAESDST